jgi:hypothetical protein
MRVASVLKIAALAGAVALLSYGPGASAKMMKRPPDSCLFHRKVIANGTVCESQCDPKSIWCTQQECQSGKWAHWISCIPPFCTAKCS